MEPEHKKVQWLLQDHTVQMQINQVANPDSLDISTEVFQGQGCLNLPVCKQSLSNKNQFKKVLATRVINSVYTNSSMFIQFTELQKQKQNKHKFQEENEAILISLTCLQIITERIILCLELVTF